MNNNYENFLEWVYEDIKLYEYQKRFLKALFEGKTIPRIANKRRWN